MADEHQHQQEIERLREDADELLAALGAEEFPDDPAVRNVRDRVEQQALKLRRAVSEPITLGVVGEFSVGKSLLLGTLLGRPDLLPVEQRATTGNVTALYLRPGAPGEPTRIEGDAEIHYLTRQELSECVREILAELVRKYEQLPGRSAAELRDYDPVEQGWDRFVTWCRRLWATDSDNPDILKIPVELLEIRRAHLSAKDLLGESVAVTQGLVREALDLGPTRSLPPAYPDHQLRPGTGRSAVKSDPEALRISFPLIRRVSYRVVVDPLAWGMERLTGGNEVVLLDFPGLTASRSAERDAYLSRSELGAVHTIITVFSMVRPGTNVPHQFYSMLARHGRKRDELAGSILAVGNLFDTVPLPRVPEDGGLAFTDVAESSQLLKMFLSNAGDLAKREERMTLVSAVRGIDHYRLPTDGFREEEARLLAEATRAARASAEDWQPIVARLPEGHWPRVLGDFVGDGGIAALRGLIEDHAAAHGLANKVSQIRREAKRLVDLLPQLERLLTPPRPADEEREKALATLRDLFDEYRAVQKYLVQAAREFRDPTKILLADGRPLLDWIHDQAAVAVCEWPEWQTIMQRAEGGFVPKNRQRTASGEPRRRRRWEAEEGHGETGESGEETTDTFFVRFADSYRLAVRDSRKLVSEAVVAWAGRHDERLGGLRDRLADHETRRHLETGLDRLRALEQRGHDRLPALEAMADLYEFLELGANDTEPPLLTDADPAAVPTDAEIDAAYPLYRGTALPWHSRVPESGGELDQRLVRHQIYVLRLRRQLAGGLSDAVTRRVIRHIGGFYQLLREDLERMLKQYVPSAGQIRSMFPEDEPRGADDPADVTSGAGSPVRDLLHEWRARGAA